MGPIFLSLLMAFFAANPPDASHQGPGASYQSKKSLYELQKCLTDKLSQRGDVTAVKMADGTTLMLREGEDAPMLIDLAPPAVVVTTRFAYGTRTIVEGCL
jgi:hypothetical protein